MTAHRALARILLGPVIWYQRWISPALPPRCRFYPTCSQYAVDAIDLHGAGRGLLLSLVRLAKCGPWHPGGVDHVPEESGRFRAAHTVHSATGGIAPHTLITARPHAHHSLENHA
jgi:hypothetical protein